MQGPTPTTNREFLIQIYAGMQDMQKHLVEISTRDDRQDEQIKKLEEWHTASAPLCGKHETAIGMLSGWRQKVLGGLAVLGSLMGLSGLAATILKTFH